MCYSEYDVFYENIREVFVLGFCFDFDHILREAFHMRALKHQPLMNVA